MSWVLPLVGSGGTGCSQCGHETRRHRIYGALFASVFASVLLAACGGGSGGNLTTSSEPELRPPGPGPLTATGGGDGQGSESENEQQQQKIIVNQEEEQEENNNEEQQQITVNVQPEPEEESESEEEEEQQQQLTIIEEEDFPYVPPEEKEYETSPQTGGGNSLARIGLPEPKEQDTYAVSRTRNGYIAGVRYSLKNAFNSDSLFNFKGKNRNLKASIIKQGTTSVDNAFNPSHAGYNFAYKEDIDRLKNIEVTYTKEDGFVGASTYKGGSNDIEADVTLKAVFYNKQVREPYIEGYIGGNDGITMNGTNFGQIRFYAEDENEDGQFIDKEVRFSNKNIKSDIGFRELRGSFKNDGAASFPTQVVGELEMKRFFDQSPLASDNYREYNENLFKRGDNALAGVFVADRLPNEEEKYFVLLGFNTTGSIGMFDYGLWASQNFLDNKIEFLEKTTKFNPGRTASDYTSHITATGSNPLRYKKKDGFKGAYVYEGEIGTLTGDVELELHFDSNKIRVVGDISRSLEIEGENLYGIGIRSTIDFTTGVGGSLESSALLANPRLRFGVHDSDWDLDITEIDDHGQAKLKMVLSPDGIQAQTGVPETYPSQIAGELEINKFKINASDGDNNTIVGVFVADKQ